MDIEFFYDYDQSGNGNETAEFTTSAPLIFHDDYKVNIPSVTVKLIVCVLGLLGNTIAIFTLLVSKDFAKTTTSWYILQLAVANSLFLLTLPFKVSEELNNEWIFSRGLCKAKETFLFLNYYASIMFITIMSVDQYFVVRNAYRNKIRNGRQSRYVAYGLTVVTWIICLACCTPVALYSEKLNTGHTCLCGYQFPIPEMTPEEYCIREGFIAKEEYEECLVWAPVKVDSRCPEKLEKNDTLLSNSIATFEKMNLTAIYELYGQAYENYDDVDVESDEISGPDCHYFYQSEPFKAFLFFNFIAMFVVPFLIMSVLYSLIGMQIRRKDNVVMKSSHEKSDSYCRIAVKSETKRRRAVVMCVIIVVLFVVCWLPFHAVHLAKLTGIKTSRDSNVCRDLAIATSILAFTHAAINPYLYMVTRGLEKFRRVFSRGQKKVIRATSQFTKTIAFNTSTNAAVGNNASRFNANKLDTEMAQKSPQLEDENENTIRNTTIL